MKNIIINNISALKIALTRDGWEEDKFGHFHKEIDGRKNRAKFQATSMRIEVRSPDGTFWIKRTGEYFGNMINDGKSIQVGRMNFLLPK